MLEQGAAVHIPQGLACLVEDEEYKCNFNPQDCAYYARVGPGLPVIRMPFMDALAALVDVGRLLFIRLESDNVSALQLGIREADRGKQFLSARLNVPTVEVPEHGKLYVTVMQKPLHAGSNVAEISSVNLALDPSDLVLNLPENDNKTVEFIVSGPVARAPRVSDQ